MALSSVTISDTIEWAKKLSFNRNSAIGNNIEPALTSANMVMQTVLGPPFLGGGTIRSWRLRLLPLRTLRRLRTSQSVPVLPPSRRTILLALAT